MLLLFFTMKLHIVSGDEDYEPAFEYIDRVDADGVLGVHFRDGGNYNFDDRNFAGIEVRHPDFPRAEPSEIDGKPVEAVDYNDLTGLGMNVSSIYEDTDVLTYFNNFDGMAELMDSEGRDKEFFQFVHIMDGRIQGNGELILQVDEDSDFYDSQFYNTIATLVDEQEPFLEEKLLEP